LKSIEKAANVLFKKEKLNGFKNLISGTFKDQPDEILNLLVQLCSKKFNHTPERILPCITSQLMF
jgi:hypothetical protein